MLDIKTYLLVRKTGPFIIKRLLPVSLIWASVALVYWTLSSGLEFFVEGGGQPALELTSLGNFADGRLVAILFFGVMAIMGLSNILMLNVSHDSNDRNRMTLFFYGLLDEVSSASTHVGAALGASKAYLIWTSAFAYQWDLAEKRSVVIILAYLCIGWATYRHEATARSPTDGDRATKSA